MGGGDGHRLPPGFRFRPTDEEVLTHYLAPKAADAGFAAPAAVREADLYGSEPWDLLPAGAGGYFFCRRSVKFPSGLRSNRATRAGYWKSTGKDKVVLRQQQGGGGGGDPLPLGLKKTLVFYRGRAPSGGKTNWVMHEYRLVQGHGGYTPPVLATGAQSEWVICRVFVRKPPGETSSLMEEETIILHHLPPNDHLINPSFDGCNDGGETPAASDPADHANCLPGAVTIAPVDDHHRQGALQQLNHEELPNSNDYSVSDHASAATAPVSSELLRQASLLCDELSSDTFDLLLPLLDYEGFPFLHDF